MLFNSLEFIIFLGIVFSIYWVPYKGKFNHQNILLLVSSYIFYGWWDYRFLALIFLSTVVDYFLAIKIAKYKEKGKILKLISVIFNLGVLGTFKYYNFFIDSLKELIKINNEFVLSIDVILPVGISFYTFQTMSYTFEVYKDKKNLETSFITFATYVAFFPQLVAGPIERSTNLIPQFKNSRNFSYTNSIQGLKLMLWGFFKKVVVADTLAPYVNTIFSQYEHMSSGMLWLGAIYFAFQIYCDFSGYSDIAIGTSKLFQIELMSNFKFPYFARNISDFWKRWHISLSSWFRDYLYIPLGGSKQGFVITLRNILIIFIVSGLWHGANWTFVVWGLLHGLLYLPYFLLRKNRNSSTEIGIIKNVLSIISTFILVTICWVFFRAETITDALLYLKTMLSSFSLPNKMRQGLLYIVILILIEYLIREDERNVLSMKNKTLQKIVFLLMVYFITLSFNLNPTSFIYFQF